MSALGAAPLALLLVGALVARSGRRGGILFIWLALGATAALARLGRAGSSGTLDADLFSLFLGGLIVLELLVSWLSKQEGERWKLLAAAAALLLVVSSRNLLWIYVGFEAFSLLSLRRRARSVGASGMAMLGLAVLAFSNRTTDLAFIEATVWSNLGVLLLTVGIAAKWLFASGRAGVESVASGIALVSLWIRIALWAPELVPIWIPAGWLCALAGSIGCALSGRTPAFLAWLTVSQIGVAALGIYGGAPALPHVLMHLAASTLSILFLSVIVEGERSRSSAAVAILALSMASVPPLPGFVTKVGLLAPLPTEALTIALAGSFLVGVGCARLIARTTETEREPMATAAAVVVALALGVFPDVLFRLASAAAAGIF